MKLLIVPLFILLCLASCNKDQTHCYTCRQENKIYGMNGRYSNYYETPSLQCNLTSSEARAFEISHTGSDTEFHTNASGTYPNDIDSFMTICGQN